MRQNRRHNTNEGFFFFEFFHRKIKESPEVFNFYSNLFSSTLTLLALSATVYFSISALRKTDTQNKNAVEQLNQAKAQLLLAQQQFQYSKQLHTEDSISSTIKEKIANDRFVKDTSKQGQREKAQEIRNHIQDAANEQQFILNKSQLKAIQIQAKTAEAQYFQQQQQYKQQQYEQRPVLNIDSINITKTNSIKSALRFYLSNKGIRIAHIDSTILAFYNPQLLCFSFTSDNANLDLIPGKTSLFTSKVNIYEACLNSNLTIYYLLIYYKDKTTGVSEIEPIFFTYKYVTPNQFSWSRARGPILKDFIISLKRKKILVIE